MKKVEICDCGAEFDPRDLKNVCYLCLDLYCEECLNKNNGACQTCVDVEMESPFKGERPSGEWLNERWKKLGFLIE